jgi:7-cyano-7-deazaguanine synthase
MMPANLDTTIGVLLSGGLDSAILVGHLLGQGRRVQPFYVRSHLVWERYELAATRHFLAALAAPRLAALAVFDMPVGDVYGEHWSLTGRGVPDAASLDTAVYLPGRNALLLLKPALWCRLHGIEQLALAVLGSNPFSDATPQFFAALEATLAQATGGGIHLLRPFAELSKQQVLSLGHRLPLGLTFSCIAPVLGLHCGQCNKCAERIAAFRAAGIPDPTVYAQPIACGFAKTENQ